MTPSKTYGEAKGKTLALGLLLAALVAAMLLARSAHAATFTVNSPDDGTDRTPGNGVCDTELFPVGTEPKCTLRAAIQNANDDAAEDEIIVPSGDYILTSAGASENVASTGDLDITAPLTITGAGARATSVAGGAAFDDRIFENHPGAGTTITGLTITGGKTIDFGGGIHNQSDLTLDRVAVKDNTADFGGGIHSSGGTFNLTDSVVSGNSAIDTGGFSRGVVGGVAQVGGAANITNSTISGNQAFDGQAVGKVGSGVLASGAFVNILNSTIASNTSDGAGGGIFAISSGTLVVVKNTIVSGNSMDNCDTAQPNSFILSEGNNISSDASCNFTQSTDKRNTNPRLGPLAGNGGPTDTRALLSGSLAIDAGTNTDCPDADQRGVDRPQGLRCDIGAFERPNGSPVATNDRYRIKEDKTLKVKPKGILRNDRDPDGDRLTARHVSGPRHGKLVLGANGSFMYKPKKNFSGRDSFIYEARDGRGGTDRAVVRIKVKPQRG